MAPDYIIWIEAEMWAAGEWNPVDDSSSVNVTFADGARWYALFVSYANIATLTAKNQRVGECLHGHFFAAPYMILVDEVSRQRIEEVVAHLIETGEFSSAFERLPPSDADEAA